MDQGTVSPSQSSLVTPDNRPVPVNARPRLNRTTSNYPSESIQRISRTVVERFNDIRLRLDEMNRQKKTEADFHSMDDLVREMMRLLEGYTILRTAGGKSRRRKRVRSS